MSTPRAGLLVALLSLGACHAPPSPPASPGSEPRAALESRPPAAAPSAPGPGAPAERGTTSLPGVRCLAPARLGVVRLGDEVALREALGPIAGPFVVLDGRTAVLVAGGRVVEASTASVVRLARQGEAEPVISGLARRPGGPLVAVAGGRLAVRATDGLAPLVPLPGDGWQVTCGPGFAYVYDPAARPGALHAIDDDLRAAKLLELPGGVSTACATSDGVAVGTPGVVWGLSPGRRPRAALQLDGFLPVGLAHDPRTGTLFASDGEQVLAVIDGVPLPLVEGLGGALAFIEEDGGAALWILDPARRVLARVAPLDWLGR